MQELEQALLAERIAAQRDRATITKLQRQINKVCIYFIVNNYGFYLFLKRDKKVRQVHAPSVEKIRYKKTANLQLFEQNTIRSNKKNSNDIWTHILGAKHCRVS